MNKKIIFRICSIIGSIAIAIVLLVTPIVGNSNTNSASMKQNVASADQVASENNYSFTGSNLIVPWSSFMGANPLQKVTSYYYTGFVSFSFSSSCSTFSLTQGINNSFIFSAFEFSLDITLYPSHWSPGSSVVWHMCHLSYGVTDVYFPLMYVIGTDFDCNVVGVNISSYVVSAGGISDDYKGASTRTLSLTIVRYFGADGDGNLDTSNFIEFCFITNNLYNSSSRFTSRTYYFTRVDEESASYSSGYSDGYSDGNIDGQSAGYTLGYGAGDTQGYYRGYSAGVDSANDYTFLGLISAVIDAPISAFTGLFNFEVFGVNLAGFLLGIFTLLIIIVVVRKLLL